MIASYRFREAAQVFLQQGLYLVDRRRAFTTWYHVDCPVTTESSATCHLRPFCSAFGQSAQARAGAEA